MLSTKFTDMRRAQGRFTTNTASEAYQRQLAAPVHKWKKAWVAPSGLAPESSYKICKWVRVEKGEDDTDDEFGGDEDEEMEEDEEGDEKEDGTPGPETDTAMATPAAETPLETPDGEAPISALPHAPTSSSGLANPPITAATSSAPSEAVTPAATAATTVPPAHPLPSNAIELTNTVPGHTEEGQGDLRGTDVGMEVHKPESGVVPASAESGAEDVKMGEETVDEPEPPVDNDEGLVHGEMEPPKAEMAVEGGDHPPPEVEK